MQKSFKRHTKDYFEALQLSTGQLRRLERIQNQETTTSRWRHLGAAPWARVALMLLILGSGWLGWQQWRQRSAIDALANEIAYNHNKQMAMEIRTASLNQIRAYLSKLDFTLIVSDRVPADQWQLLGARYCSLQGKLAAQLKLRRLSSGEVVTLFQTVFPEHAARPSVDGQEFVQGVHVELWSERGLLLGMASGH